MDISTELKNPHVRYRPVPFWSWNDRLEPEELRQQIRQMHEAGLGGYFMHARGGLLTEYMGEEWFECVRASVDEGRKLGMCSWAYDENGWPSGFGDGLVNGLGPRYQQKYLRLEPVRAGQAERTAHTLGFFRADGSLWPEGEDLRNEELLHAYYELNPYYVDTLDAKVIRTFLEKIYLPYREKLSPDDRREMKGFFTDEPQVSRNGLPWSFILEEEYAQEYGEKLLPRLAELFRDVGDFRRTRYRFWRLVTLLFMNNFMKQIHDWCEEHDFQVTGHHVCEDTFCSQLTSNGAVMPHYQYYHIPGMDWLGRRIRPLTVPMQVASVCAQVGKKQILSETFGLCGWGVKFEELRWIYQWQMVHGINLLCQHLESYSLKGIRKRDYPASLFSHQPWWGDYRRFNDYVSRLGVLLMEGEIRTDVLVLHGQSSAWLSFNGKPDPRLDRYFESLNLLSEKLDSAHVNYHYGDETVIAMHGSAKDGKFIVGRQSYGVVVLPQMKNLAPETLLLLQRFLKDGGVILGVRNKVETEAFYVGGQRSAELDALLEQIKWFADEQALAEAIHGYTEVCPVVQAGTPAENLIRFPKQLGAIASTRRFFSSLNGAPAKVYYFVNNSQSEGFEAEIHLAGKSVERFDPATGACEPVLFRTRSEGQLTIPHYFCPAGDLVLVARETAAAPAAEIPFARRHPRQLPIAHPEIDLGGEYRIDGMTANVLTLDYCAFSVDGELQAENEYVLSIQDRLLRLKRPADLEMDFKFNVSPSYDLSSELFLLLERPELYKLEVNGTAVATTDCGFLFDPAFRQIDIRKAVRTGENVIRLRTTFSQPEEVYQKIEASKIFESEKNKLSYGMEIEAIYLAGDFGVKTGKTFQPLEREAVRFPRGFALEARHSSAKLDNLLPAGLPFFSGTLRLSRKFNLAPGQERGRHLVFDRLMGNVCKFRVNGKEVPPVIWKPYAVALEGLLQPGENRLKIELTNSLRNMLGPHHLAEGESHAVGPWCFHKEAGVFSNKWGGGLVDWDDDYCLVEFGLERLRIV